MSELKSTQSILKKFGLRFEMDSFIDLKNPRSLEPPPWLLDDLDFALAHRGPADKETFTCEFVIVPLLKEVWKRHRQVNLFSHVAIQADDLVAIPDYVIAAKTATGWKDLEKPLLLTTEAKYEKFDDGWSQALFQAVICQKINQSDQIPILMLVTNGEMWQFGKLEKGIFSRHPLPASIQQPALLLGILDDCFAMCVQHAMIYD